jgi:rhodanese-related sulfurtransferase
MLPGAFAYTYLGYAGREALGGGEGLFGKGLLALAVLGMVAFLPRLLRRVREARVVGVIGAAELRLRLARREDITVLDVRSAGDYAGDLGHIEPSLNIPLDQLPGRLAELEPVRERRIAVICRTNRLSSQAAGLLRKAGFRRVQLVTDGMLAWRQQEHA